jgi:nitroreductase
MTLPTKKLSVIDAVANRRSVRRFLSHPVTRETIHTILAVASRAPSGTNIQPWKIHVVTDNARARLSKAVIAAAEKGERCDEYEYMPATLKEQHLEKRRKVGFDLYKLYGIARDDHAARKEAMLCNFEFFGAPMGLFFTMDRYLLNGSWLDCGMYMQNVMIVAREFGLETCPQQAWCEYGGIVHDELGISQDQIIVSGMALGYEDKDAIVNTLASQRDCVDLFTTFHSE